VTVVSAQVNSDREKNIYFILYPGNGQMSAQVYVLLQTKRYIH